MQNANVASTMITGHAGILAPTKSQAALLKGTKTLVATRPRHLLDSVGGVLALLPLFLLAALPVMSSTSGNITPADVDALVAMSELPQGGLTSDGSIEAARREEADAISDFSSVLCSDVSPSARLLTALATLQVCGSTSGAFP
jgi:hypothetical protein